MSVQNIKVKAGLPFIKQLNIKGLVAVKIGGKLYDLQDVPEKEVEVEPVLMTDSEGLNIIRHSAAHLLAHAVKQLFPDAKPNAGPVTEDGFYYDIMMPFPDEEGLKKIEDKMKELSEKKIPIVKEYHNKKELEEIFKDNQFKLDKIEKNVNEGSTVYRQGDFVDFCMGPHVPNTSYLKHFRLLNIASTNYLGDTKREKLVRIYGTIFPDRKSLEEFMHNREEAAKRDHRKIGAEMELFVFNSEVAPGLPLFSPKGTVIRNELIRFMREINEIYGWNEVYTPHIFKDLMWKISGHYAKYKDDMFLFTLSDGVSYALKPMNCPGHITIYKNYQHSYRDLPVKYSEFGTVYRYEKSGEVGGLSRPRTFTIDDGHGILRKDQIGEEIKKVLEMIKIAFETIFGGIEIKYDLSVIDKNNPENYLLEYKCKKCGHINEPIRASAEKIMLTCEKCGSDELAPDFSLWDNATEQLRESLKSLGKEYGEFPGEAAFYGPKIDVHVRDALGRSWQLSTVQVDFFMPRAFELYFINENSQKEIPVMIHRAIYGSIERLMVILLESTEGHLPTWLSPIQVYEIPVSENVTEYSMDIYRELRNHGLRVFIDNENQSLSKKIKMSNSKKPSYYIIIGQKEKENGTVTVRDHSGKNVEMKREHFIEALLKEIKERKSVKLF